MAGNHKPLELVDEELVRLSDLAIHLPWKPTRCTVWKWTTSGFHGVVLESVKLGGLTMTSRQAVDRFLSRTGLGVRVYWTGASQGSLQ